MPGNRSKRAGSPGQAAYAVTWTAMLSGRVHCFRPFNRASV
jgi:hypothetical protein